MANPGDRLARCIFDRWSALPSIFCCDMLSRPIVTALRVSVMGVARDASRLFRVPYIDHYFKSAIVLH